MSEDYFNKVGEDNFTNNSMSAHENSVGENNAESVLAFVAKTILILGILISVIAGYGIMSIPYGSSLGGLVVIVLGIIISLVSWASLMVIVNISNNIREIKHRLDKK